MIVIQKSTGFPLLCKGSHVLSKGNTDIASESQVGIWQGAIIVTDPNLAVQDPAVKGYSGAAIILLY